MKKQIILLMILFESIQGYCQSKEDSIYTFLKKYDYSHIDTYVKLLNYQNSIEEQTTLIIKPYKNDYEKARAIYIWITRFISYDNSQIIRSAEETFKYRKGVCEGFAKLFARMCTLAGLTVDLVTGYARGHMYEHAISFKDGMRHAWNIIIIKDEKFIIDATWALSLREQEYFYLADPAAIIKTHYPDLEANQLLKKTVNVDYFLNPSTYYRKNKILPIIEPIYKLI